MIYSLIIIIRNKCYDYNILNQYQAPCHIISIGNLKTGGTGKTPLSILVAKELTKIGKK